MMKQRMEESTLDPRALRIKSRLNQAEFWGAIGVTQSGGSRYENERRMPEPVAQLVRLHYVLGIDTRDIDGSNADGVRALLSGELDPGALMTRAERARALSASLNQMAANASALRRRGQSISLDIRKTYRKHSPA